MRKSLRNLGSLLLVCSLVGMSLTGCSQKAEEKTASDTASEAVAENKEFSYPMKTDKTLLMNELKLIIWFSFTIFF